VALLTGAALAAVFRFDGERLHFVAGRSPVSGAVETDRQLFPRPLAPGSPAARAILEDRGWTDGARRRGVRFAGGDRQRAGLADGTAEISVTDTGIGIAAEHHDAVFEEFQTAWMISSHVGCGRRCW
jgi:signal transduction histidine kinase